MVLKKIIYTHVNFDDKINFYLQDLKYKKINYFLSIELIYKKEN
jgi:hypothetical protein